VGAGCWLAGYERGPQNPWRPQSASERRYETHEAFGDTKYWWEEERTQYLGDRWRHIGCYSPPPPSSARLPPEGGRAARQASRQQAPMHTGLAWRASGLAAPAPAPGGAFKKV
jgi:hypothetical protein